MDEDILELDLTIFGEKDREKIKEEIGRYIYGEIESKEKEIKNILFEEYEEENK